MPNRCQQNADPNATARTADAEPFKHRLNDFVELQPLVDVQFGGEPHLRVDDVVGGEIFRTFGGHSHERVTSLHDRERVGERLQISLE